MNLPTHPDPGRRDVAPAREETSIGARIPKLTDVRRHATRRRLARVTLSVLGLGVGLSIALPGSALAEEGCVYGPAGNTAKAACTGDRVEYRASATCRPPGFVGPLAENYGPWRTGGEFSTFTCPNNTQLEHFGIDKRSATNPA